MYKNQKYIENPIQTKADLQKLVVDMTEALRPFYSDGKAFLKLGETMTHYSKTVAYAEGFLRPLFGLAPLSHGGGKSDMWDIYIEGIANGTNPDSDEYWGDVHGGQIMVEMNSLAIALILTPQELWEPLSETEKKNLSNWLYQINRCDVRKNNWAFFTVMVNFSLKRLGEKYSQEKIDEAFEYVEKCYTENGWYTDGKYGFQADYYIPFAFHYYGLIYAAIAENDDAERSKKFKERARMFAKDFICWFDENGSGVPFGRSLTYRFAMSAFFGALAFANVEAIPWGQIKGMLLRNLRWWMKKPIFSDCGYMSIGYAYPNLRMSEFYNAPGSPAWAMKAFLPLALPDNHPFWTAKEEVRPKVPEVSMQKTPNMLVCNEQDRAHSFILTSGQYAGFGPEAVPAKYEKFAYSSVFGFSVPSGEIGLEQGAFDSTLAFCEYDNLYRTRNKCESAEVTENFVKSVWKPYNDVTVTSWIIPMVPYHVRIHKIISGRKLLAAEGGFALEYNIDEEELKNITDSHKSEAETERALSGIYNLYGIRTGKLINARSNTNIMYPQTVIPMFINEIEIGETILVSAVLGQPCAGEGYSNDNLPSVSIKNDIVEVEYNGIKTIKLGE